MKALRSIVALLFLSSVAFAEPRKFVGLLLQILPDAALANGSLVIPVEKKKADDAGFRYQELGDVYISGIPAGAVDNTRWKGWVVADGTKSFTAVSGARRTLQAFRVVAEPPTTAVAKKPGDWMSKK